MTDDALERLWQTATDYYVPVSAVAGGAGVVMYWQDLGPSWLAMGLLIGGVGWYAYRSTAEDGEENSNPEPKSKNPDPEEAAPPPQNPSEFDIGEDEAPWWDTEAYPTTKDRIEAMKRQDPDYEEDEDGETDDESILDKFARVLGMDEDSGGDGSESDSDRSEPLFEPIEADLGPDLEIEAEVGDDVGGLENELDFGGDLEANLEDDDR